jgi:single-strand DNA-binding protein
MLNQVVLVGRLTRNPEVKELDDGKRLSGMTLAIPRSFKNAEGEYETDFIEVKLWNQIAENTAEYCKKGDIIGVKGRLQTDNYEKENGEKVFKLNVIAEKVTFLSSRSHDEKEHDDMER